MSHRKHLIWVKVRQCSGLFRLFLVYGPVESQTLCSWNRRNCKLMRMRDAFYPIAACECHHCAGDLLASVLLSFGLCLPLVNVFRDWSLVRIVILWQNCWVVTVVYKLALSPQPLGPLCCSSLVSGSSHSNTTQSVGREVNRCSFRFSGPFSGIVPYLCPNGTPLFECNGWLRAIFQSCS